MPNTLVHIGINGLITKTVIKKSDLLWIYLGCLIPDFPWITRKVLFFLFPSINGYDLQAYVIVQASLYFCLFLSAIFASISKNFLRTFLILSFGSLLHLLLDPIQIKWGNGVHLFAPFSWDLTNYGIFWPESFVNYLLTLAGLIFFIYNWKNLKFSKPELYISSRRILIILLLSALYFSLPLKYISDVKNSNNHFISTLENYENRHGNYVEMDRKEIYYNNKTNSYCVKSFNNDKIELENVKNNLSDKLSIRGKFVTNDLIYVYEYHENWVLFRDGASYLGLILILFAWIISYKDKKI